MASKVVDSVVKLQVGAGEAKPAKVGTSLGPKGINIADFCKQFNDKTSGEKVGRVFPVIMTIYKDKSFVFIIKTPPASVLLLEALGLQKGSGVPNREKIGRLTRAQIEGVAKIKMPDLNASTLEAAFSIIEGTAKSMGIDIEEESV